MANRNDVPTMPISGSRCLRAFLDGDPDPYPWLGIPDPDGPTNIRMLFYDYGDNDPFQRAIAARERRRESERSINAPEEGTS